MKPTLIVMAAGMGSRYGGLKQIDPVTEQGEIIMDFSLYDAMMAGFERAVFVIRRENEEAFRRLIDSRAGKFLETEIVYQEMDDLPPGYTVPAGRTKPWGTCHAVLSARHAVKGPFAVINADDYYGAEAYMKLYDFLEARAAEQEAGQAPAQAEYAMIGFDLGKTLTENGTVARGICEVSPEGYLQQVTERTKIRRARDEAEYTEDDGNTWSHLPGNAATSMNFWCFAEDFMGRIGAHFERFLKEEVAKNPLKSECYLPTVVSALLSEGKCDVQVIKTSDKWHGVTYKEDKPALTEAIREMKRDGLYPQSLW